MAECVSKMSLTWLDDIADTLFFTINNNLLIILKQIMNMCTFEKRNVWYFNIFFIEQKSLSY